MSRPRLRFSHAVLGPMNGGETVLGLGPSPAAALVDARAWQAALGDGSIGPLRVVRSTDPLVHALLEERAREEEPA